MEGGSSILQVQEVPLHLPLLSRMELVHRTRKKHLVTRWTEEEQYPSRVFCPPDCPPRALQAWAIFVPPLFLIETLTRPPSLPHLALSLDLGPSQGEKENLHTPHHHRQIMIKFGGKRLLFLSLLPTLKIRLSILFHCLLEWSPLYRRGLINR